MTVENMMIEDDDSVEVELASAWERIGAYIINYIFTMLAFVPMGVAFGMGAVKLARENDLAAMQNGQMSDAELWDLLAGLFTGWFWLGALIALGYGAWQIYLMSKYGQSLGKKLLNLRVIRTNGDDAGFVNVVLLREVLYNIALSVMISIFGIMGDVGTLLGNLAQLAVFLACVVMLFAHSERRTLQDLLADTVVIKLPR